MCVGSCENVLRVCPQMEWRLTQHQWSLASLRMQTWNTGKHIVGPCAGGLESVCFSDVMLWLMDFIFLCVVPKKRRSTRSEEKP